MNPSCCIAIDLKSFYASVECVERKLDPLTTNLVVADRSRTERTICLAVTPSLKAYGIPARIRLFDLIRRVQEVNDQRRRNAPRHRFSGKSTNALELAADPALELDYLVATPRMARYVEVSSQVYEVYLKYFAPEHIHVYSIDEVFIDATPYLKLYKLSPRDLAMKIVRDVLAATGITATAGIGTNLYLSKVAMDIVAKRIPADKDGVRVAELDERSYREKLWTHTPLSDFWRIGRGYASRLERMGLRTMGDIARLSLWGEEFLYRAFGVNAELLIDHAWGWEPVTIAEIKAFKPENSSLSYGQVLHRPYEFDQARVVALEMADQLALNLVEKNLMTDEVILSVRYDRHCLDDPERRMRYSGPVTTDRFGYKVPKRTYGGVRFGSYTSSGKQLMDAVAQIFDHCVNPDLTLRRMTVVAIHVRNVHDVPEQPEVVQPDFFVDYESVKKRQAAEQAEDTKENRLQQAVLSIKKRWGKNAMLKGVNFIEGATGRDRNEMIGGHHK